MRVVRVFCALLIFMSCAPLTAAGQHDAVARTPPNPAFPPASPPPLYFSSRKPGEPLASEDLRRLQRYGVVRIPNAKVVVISQRQPEDEFRPISELPLTETLPAGRMLVAAYVFVVLALFVYVLSIARRLNAVGRDIARIDAQLKRH